MLSSRNSNPLVGKKLEMEKKVSPKDSQKFKLSTQRYNNKKNMKVFRETEYKSPTNKLLADENLPKPVK